MRHTSFSQAPDQNAQLHLAHGASLVENGAVRKSLKIFVMAAALFYAELGNCGNVAQARQSASRSHIIPPPEARVDINHATVDELIKAPGMTRTWAERIVRFRPYRTKQDLYDHGVVTGEVYNRIKDYIIAHREKQ